MRAVDKRAAELTPEYFKKARTTDRQYCGTEPGTTGPVETKLGTMGLVEGIVLGATGEGSEPLHSLIHHLALSRVRVAGPQVGRRGQVRQEAAEVAITYAFLRRVISGCAGRPGPSWTAWRCWGLGRRRRRGGEGSPSNSRGGMQARGGLMASAWHRGGQW